MLSGDVAITADGASLPPHATERKNGTTAPLPVFVRLFRVTFQSLDRYVNDHVAIRVPATSTDARMHVTRNDESPKEHMNEPVLVYVSSDIDHREP